LALKKNILEQKTDQTLQKMNQFRTFSIFILFLLGLSSGLYAQVDSSKTSYFDGCNKNMIGIMSLGFKNTYGGWGIFYLRRLPWGKTVSRLRIGCGVKGDFVVGGGSDLRFYTDHKKLELFGSLDYSYNFPGVLRYGSDRDKNSKTDLYNYTECQYLHTYISTHYLFSNGTASLQLKTGYAFLLNTVMVTHSLGPDDHYRSAKRLTNGGLMVGLDFIICFNHKDQKQKNR
jgi:hypothetical protein